MKNALKKLDAILLKVPTKVAMFVFVAAILGLIGYTANYIHTLETANSNLVDRVNAMRRGDITEDGVIDINDVSILSANWSGAKVKQVTGDLNGDGKVDGVDLSTLLSNWSDPTEAAPNAELVSPKPIFRVTSYEL